MSLEVLHFALMLLCFFERVKRAQIAALACFGVLLPRVQTILAGLEFSNHVDERCA